MKRISIALFLVVISLSSCWHMFGKRIHGNGNIQTESRNVTGFNSIEVSGAIDVFVKQDSVQSVKIETDANLMEYIVVREEGGTLKIYPRDNSNLNATGSTKVYVTGPEFRKFDASGASDFYSQNKITSKESITIDLSGSSDADMEFYAPKIVAEITGASKLALKGETRDLSLDGTGSSDFKCFEMMAENVDVDVTGASDAEIFASIKLDIKATGASNVKYKGSPAISQTVTGAGSVKKVE